MNGSTANHKFVHLYFGIEELSNMANLQLELAGVDALLLSITGRAGTCDPCHTHLSQAICRENSHTFFYTLGGIGQNTVASDWK